ncbi:hypothetical protein THTE_0378 [Thermogutta terrifontis]|uniref:Uncharacterized protein n=1 Tax=Thermogutta terrifontis TaxID=1331910 RepID=A0A286RAK7_9BACT|nr:hypothetical protein THTE_0378 [Thermogutta terrifontis]
MTYPSSSGTTSVPLRPFGGTCLSRSQFNDRPCIAFQRARQACPTESFLGRDPLVGSAFRRWIIHSLSPGTKVPR